MLHDRVGGIHNVTFSEYTLGTRYVSDSVLGPNVLVKSFDESPRKCILDGLEMSSTVSVMHK